MHLKDYYQILNLSTSASIADIKKAYRQLALKYHPDKNHNDSYAAAQFTEIKEAYEVLTNPAKKEYYLQHRWYEQSIGKRTTQKIITPVTVLQQALELEKYVAKLDVFRMDKYGLKDYILGLISKDIIKKIQGFNEPSTVKEIITIILCATKPLPKTLTPEIFQHLYLLSADDEEATFQVQQYEKSVTQQHKKEKHTLLILLFVTAILCLLIWLTGR